MTLTAPSAFAAARSSSMVWPSDFAVAGAVVGAAAAGFADSAGLPADSAGLAGAAAGGALVGAGGAAAGAQATTNAAITGTRPANVDRCRRLFIRRSKWADLRR